ncbi:secretory carrier-associated membrane protein 1 [Sinocyclocheilus anshuiensis]|uniref:secretory carrier-associated membrane protein 1 n=1 Tax=Sinocyclocheilus anshuiensis TaxID=1608454 RepID=UPI0007BA6224|nr:PREDICTED: secretory carrier-associated membrane protein 1-like [Sinocyclocheilus anshuiensis]
MSDFDSNPFADPDFSNPFQDPSVTQVTRTAPPGLEEYNPFTDTKPVPPGSAPKSVPPTANTQPAIMKPTEEPPAYTQPQQTQDQVRAQAELLRRQEELERKAAELDRREREMQSLSSSGGRKNNWPPLPEKFPVGPCFYHDISVDIPVEYQKTVKIMYYLWMFHTGTLFANIFGCLSWFCVDASRGVDFGLAISIVYVCSGWISALTGLNTSIPVGIIMILIAALFTASAVISLIMFKKVHALYRTTGASFEKAQQEFATGVMANKTVQTATANAASSAARGAFKEQI